MNVYPEYLLERIKSMEAEAQRLLVVQNRAAGDDSHYYRASLQHYTDWLIANGYMAPAADTVANYLDAMRGRSIRMKTRLRTRKILKAVRRAFP